MKKIFGNIQYYRILPTIENNYSSTKNSRATFFKAIRLSSVRPVIFRPCLTAGMAFSCGAKIQTPPMGQIIPAEALNRPFQRTSSHDETPQRG
jgi:hypothetical protein